MTATHIRQYLKLRQIELEKQVSAFQTDLDRLVENIKKGNEQVALWQRQLDTTSGFLQRLQLEIQELDVEMKSLPIPVSDEPNFDSE